MSTSTRLRAWEYLAHFNDAQIARFGEAVTERTVAAGEPVFREGDASREAFLINRGTVEIRRSTPYGEYDLARLGDGEMFGELSFVDSLPRSGDAVAVDAVHLLAFEPDRIASLAEEDKPFEVAVHWSLWKSLSSKLRTTNEQLSRFFIDGGAPPPEEAAEVMTRGRDFHLDLAAKRALFAEHKLSRMEVNFLSTLSKERDISEGEVIFHEGEVGDELFIVVDGRVMISKFIPGAGEEALAFLERGAFFGEMALIDRRPRSADAKADSGGAVLLAIPREVIEGILDIEKVSSLKLLTLLSKLVARRLRELDEKLITWYIFSGGDSSRDEAAAALENTDGAET